MIMLDKRPDGEGYDEMPMPENDAADFDHGDNMF